MCRSISTFIFSLPVVFALAACGGGGGGDDSGPALTFDPATVTASYAAGATKTVVLTATATNPKNFGDGVLEVRVLDADSMLGSTVDTTQIGADSVLVTLHLSTSKPAGHYTGNFTVQLCKNAGCSVQLPGSPVSLPYDITITP